jgi:hypothetical protein
MIVLSDNNRIAPAGFRFFVGESIFSVVSEIRSWATVAKHMRTVQLDLRRQFHQRDL